MDSLIVGFALQTTCSGVASYHWRRCHCSVHAFEQLHTRRKPNRNSSTHSATSRTQRLRFPRLARHRLAGKSRLQFQRGIRCYERRCGRDRCARHASTRSGHDQCDSQSHQTTYSPRHRHALSRRSLLWFASVQTGGRGSVGTCRGPRILAKRRRCCAACPAAARLGALDRCRNATGTRRSVAGRKFNVHARRNQI